MYKRQGRDLVSVADKAVLDGYYVDNMSLSMDWQILQRTVGYVLRARDISEGATIGAVTGEYRLTAYQGKKRITFSLIRIRNQVPAPAGAWFSCERMLDNERSMQPSLRRL